MSRTKMLLARRWGTAIVGMLLLAALVLIGCGGATEVAEEPAAPTIATTEPAAPTDLPTEPPTPTDLPTEPPPTDTPAPTDTPEPTEAPPPTDTPTPEIVDDTACIGCHTDEETLKAVAEEPEETESLSEGEG